MPKLFSNPWRDKATLRSKIKFNLRKLFYRYLLRKYCRKCKTALDVGCAEGQFLRIADELGYKAFGLELDERFKRKNVFIGDVYKFKGKYNIVFNNHIIEGMEHEKFVKKLCELSNDIVITIGMYNCVSFYNTPDFKMPVTKVRLRWLFRRYGFRNLLSIHIPFWRAVLVVSKKIKDEDNDWEAKKIREGFW